MKKTLPFIISVPHGGTRVPREVKGKFLLDHQEVLRDGDTWTRELFDLEEETLQYIATEIPRVIVDLNRGKEDLPPANFDGVVKSKSVFLNPVWEPPLTTVERNDLLKKYYDPYFEKLTEASIQPGIKLGIDCHSMLPEDPFNEQAEKRPLICISNRGGLLGENIGESLTAPQSLLLEIKGIFEEEFGEGSVGLNDPFKGGYITKHMAWENGIPWIQLEINRVLYMPMEGKIDASPFGEHERTVKEIRGRILGCLKRITL